ncbi:hypothetical protein EDD86DRAFT_138458 [Gorgonomyces haynaldii]|nr:hypothetical protein EDD86DRAFT_138458 [Gorgonomyces haynaldii]
MALRYHPDKAGQTPENVLFFQQIQKAYNTLSDPKMRKLYDQYGENGIRMMESMGGMPPFLDPEAFLSMKLFFTVATAIVALIIVFFSLVAVKAEGGLSWSWTAVFWPVYVVVSFLFLGVLFQKMTPDEEDPNAVKAAKAAKTQVLLYFGSFAAFCVLIPLRIDQIITVHWGIVFVPWFILELLNLFMLVINVQERLQMPEYESVDEQETFPRSLSWSEKLVIIYTDGNLFVLRIIQAILLIVKLQGHPMSWPVTFVPVWIWGGLRFSSFVYRYYYRNRLTSEEVGPLVAQFVAFVLSSIFLFTTVGLLVKKLESAESNPTAAVLLIPVFIILSLLFCCVCCCGPIAIQGARQEMQDQMQRGTQVVIPLNRSINQ